MKDISTLTPQQTVKELDKHIIGQNAAKRAVAVALRNRWRRMNLEPSLQAEVTPTNILMIGPTGVGKTEIARRLAKLTQAPFIKVEATKFTEVGYVGRDVESIIRDLAEVGIKEERKLARQQVISAAEKAVEERILDVLLPPRKNISEEEKNSPARQTFRKQLQEGKLEDTEIEVDIALPPASLEIIGSHPGFEEISNQIQSMFQQNNHRTQTRKLKIHEARKLLLEEEANKLLNEEEIKVCAIAKVEQQGIVFIDEIDKVAKRAEHSSGGDVSREGVQRDLLPLVEGSTVSTKYGMIKTDYILFIASGAFHVAKPSDLIPELQGRFPIRVELSDLSVEDFIRILTQTDASLISQYIALLATENVTLEFTEDSIQSMATSAWEANQLIENIGARRLKTVMGLVLEEILFEASERSGEVLTINEAYVKKRLTELLKKRDLMRYIL